MRYDFDPNLIGTRLKYLEIIDGNILTLKDEERILFSLMYEVGQEQVSGGRVYPEFNRELNDAYLAILAELAQVDGKVGEVDRLEGIRRGLKKERE